MKVICRKFIQPVTKEEKRSSSFLTVGNEYIVLALAISPRFGVSVFIQADVKAGHTTVYPELEGFEMVSHYIPSNWELKIDEHGGIDMMPRSWMYKSFPDDFNDGKSKALELFHKESKIIYEEEYENERNCKAIV